MKSAFKILREAIPEAIGAIIATIILSIFSISEQNLLFNPWFFVFLVLSIIWVACFHFAFKRKKSIIIYPSSVHKKKKINDPWKYQRVHNWALVGILAIPLFTLIGYSVYDYQLSLLPRETIILIADFDGPEPKQYRVTETIISSLKNHLDPYDEIQVQALGRPITELEGSELAIEIGQQKKASIVIWGWYGITDESALLNMHFELLQDSFGTVSLCHSSEGKNRTYPKTLMDSFSLQTNLSGELTYLSLFSVGMAQYWAENSEEAIEFFNDALSQSSNLESTSSLVNLHFYLGSAYQKTNDYSNAIKSFSEVINRNPGHARALFGRGNSYLESKNFEAALNDYNEVAKIQEAKVEQELGAVANITEGPRVAVWFENPGRSCIYNNRGNAYAKMGMHEEALSDYERAIELNRDNPDFHFNRGNALYELGDLTESIESYNKVLSLDSDYAEVYLKRGISYYHINDLQNAENDFLSCLDSTPKLNEPNVIFSACNEWLTTINENLNNE